ncbi:MAG: aspartate aminotransferase family protein [Neomegalonema sp.]|nr:aspartate aminotransferase family protein [Neomegalonema sp.]
MAYQNRSHDQWRAIDAAHHLHPFTDHKALRAEGSRIITRAEGPYIYDADGREILDAMAGLWNVNVGYGREELVEAAAQQMRELPFYNTFFKSSVPSAALLAQKIAELAPPSINQVFYGSSGSESNDTAIRLVRHFWVLEGKPDKQVIIARQMGYHGSTIAAVSMGGMGAMRGQLYTALPGFEHIMPPYAYGEAREGESEDAFAARAAQALEDKILEVGPEKVAAFIGEPVQGAGGVKIPPKGYWQKIEAICRKYDILLMADEVITGFGRTGEWFGCQHYGFTPDTITVAKGITSGYVPLSALLVGDRVAQTLIEKGEEFYHGYTYAGHPVACAVALKNIEIMEREGLVARVRTDTGPYLAESLARFADHPIVGEVRSVGLLGAIELVADKASKRRMAGPGEAGTLCRDHCFANDYIMRAVGDTLIMSPPLSWTRAEIDLAMAKIARVLDLTEQSARERGWL